MAIKLTLNFDKTNKTIPNMHVNCYDRYTWEAPTKKILDP